MKIVLAALLTLTASIGHTQTLTSQQKLSDLNQLFTTVEAGYGPLHFKADKIGLNIEDLRRKYEPLTLQSKNNSEFYYLMRKLVAEFRDGHFGMVIPTNHLAELPISTDLVQGRVLIDTVDRAQLSVEQFPYQRGDEIVSVDGTPIAQVVDELQSYVNSGYDMSARRIAAAMVFFRAGKGVPVPSAKTVRFEVRRGTSSVVEPVELNWKFSGQPLDERRPTTFYSTSIRPVSRPRDTLWLRPALEELVGRQRVEKSYRCSGSTRIAIPKDATMIMEKPFVAYYHPTAKGNVGYVRIPDYYPLAADGKTFQFEQRFAQYEYAIRELEANTVGLIIDQDHNCGGSVSYLDKMVGLFMDHDYKGLQFQYLANKAEYLSNKKELDEMTPNTIAWKNGQKIVDLILKHWQAGDFMTPVTSSDGSEYLKPNPVRYSKPVVMLIDEMSGSGGDAFPGLMQGYGRAVLVGTRTMGLGGHVTEQPSLPYSQLGLRMTKSLFFRPDGTPVENNGVVPNVAYEITRDDFMYGYKAYQAFYLKTLTDML